MKACHAEVLRTLASPPASDSADEDVGVPEADASEYLSSA